MVPIGKEGNTVSYFFWKQENEGFESSERRRFQTNNLFLHQTALRQISKTYILEHWFFWTSLQAKT